MIYKVLIGKLLHIGVCLYRKIINYGVVTLTRLGTETHHTNLVLIIFPITAHTVLIYSLYSDFK